MSAIPIEGLIEWKEAFARIRRGIESSCPDSVRARLVTRCDELARQGEARGEYSESDYLEFAEEVLGAASRDVGGAQLGLDLTRIHCDVGEKLRSSNRLREVAEVALARPADFTEANRVFVSDLVHSALSWRAEAALAERGIDGLVEFLQNHPYFHSKDGAFCRRSIVRRLASLALRNDASALAALGRAFRSDPGIIKDIMRVRGGG